MRSIRARKLRKMAETIKEARVRNSRFPGQYPSEYGFNIYRSLKRFWKRAHKG